MRARRFQPSYDRLDTRLLLDGSGSTPPPVSYPGDEIDLTAEMAANTPTTEYPADGGGPSGGGTNSPPPNNGPLTPTTPQTS